MWKKYKFKYVKFSKGTARNNPNMIINEYNRIISDINSKVSFLWDRKHEIRVVMSPSRALEHYSKTEEITVSLNSLEVMKCYKKIKSEYSEALILLERMEKVKEELAEFKMKYKK